MMELLFVRATEEAGCWAMARDEALFDLLASAGRRRALRLHGWSHPTLTLGRGQHPPRALIEAAHSKGVEVVRRPTGGGWLIHLPGDFTATVAFSSPLRAGELRGSARSVAEAYGGALESLGCRARVVQREDRRSGRAEICFQRADREEVVAGRIKLAGVALARVGRGALVQSAVPLSTPGKELEEFCAAWDPLRRDAIRELSGVPCEELASEMARNLARVLAATLVETPWPATAEAHARERYTSRYATTSPFQPAAGAPLSRPMPENR